MKNPNRREIQSFLLTRTQGKGVFLLTLFGVDEALEIRDKNLHSRPFHFILKNTTKGHIFHKEQIYVRRSIIWEYICFTQCKVDKIELQIFPKPPIKCNIWPDQVVFFLIKTGPGKRQKKKKLFGQQQNFKRVKKHWWAQKDYIHRGKTIPRKMDR